MGKPQLYHGKTRTQIAEEGFKRYGPEATREQINRVFKEFGAAKCEQSMYFTVKGKTKRALGIKTGTRPKTPEGLNKTETIRKLYRERGVKVSYDEMQRLVAQKFPGVQFHSKLFYDARKDVEKEQRQQRQQQRSPAAARPSANGTLEKRVAETCRQAEALSSQLGGFDKVEVVAETLKLPELKLAAQMGRFFAEQRS